MERPVQWYQQSQLLNLMRRPMASKNPYPLESTSLEDVGEQPDENELLLPFVDLSKLELECLLLSQLLNLMGRPGVSKHPHPPESSYLDFGGVEEQLDEIELLLPFVDLSKSQFD